MLPVCNFTGVFLGAVTNLVDILLHVNSHNSFQDRCDMDAGRGRGIAQRIVRKQEPRRYKDEESKQSTQDVQLYSNREEHRGIVALRRFRDARERRIQIRLAPSERWDFFV